MKNGFDKSTWIKIGAVVKAAFKLLKALSDSLVHLNLSLCIRLIKRATISE
jgi:hypothetical protein